jgi:hypothetical protein
MEEQVGILVGLPAPSFEQRQRSLVVTLWRDWLTQEVLDRLGLINASIASYGRRRNQGQEWIGSRSLWQKGLAGILDRLRTGLHAS